jgi:transglutaminase-like putative cysteine protease
MSLEIAYRVLNHATLALACLCLIASEDLFLPWIWYAVGPVLVVVMIAARCEGRWLLTASAANVLGGVIAVAGLAWILWMLWMSGYFTALYALPLPTALVPYLGPPVLTLMLVKLFRPRTPRDFWLLQGLALLQVVLGCILAGGALFGVLLAGYVVCGLGCLTLHHLRRRRAVPGAIGSADCPLPFAGLLLPFLARWGLAVGGLALLLFLLAPRGHLRSWDPFTIFSPRGGPAQAGFAEGINLNRTGAVEVSDDPAFTVVVRDAEGRPCDDLPPGQRWRGALLEYYTDGVWASLQRMPRRAIFPLPEHALLAFGPDDRHFEFTVEPRRAGGVFLAEPVCLGPAPGPRLPVLVETPAPEPLFFETYAGVFPWPLLSQERYRYRQVVRAGADPDRAPAEGLNRWLRPDAAPPDDEREERRQRAAVSYFVELKSSSTAELRRWANDCLRRLAAKGRYGLTAEDTAPLTGEGQLRVPANAERVARALTEMLASSGEYTYTLELRRADFSLDPVLDFLTNVKQGHCERYASALALLLRARGIPARVVKGYRGFDPLGDGSYLVRQRHAHSWVEALVRTDGGHGPGLEWLTLDPTPAFEAPPPTASWWGYFAWPNLQLLWHDLIQELSADRQADLWGRVLLRHPEMTRLLGWLAVAAGLFGLVAAVRYWRRHRRPRAGKDDPLPATAAPVLACLKRLLALLAGRYQLRPQPGQTLREFARLVSECLDSEPPTRGLADLPDALVAVYYRARFGEEAVESAELRALDERTAALAAIPRGG